MGMEEIKLHKFADCFVNLPFPQLIFMFLEVGFVENFLQHLHLN